MGLCGEAFGIALERARTIYGRLKSALLVQQFGAQLGQVNELSVLSPCPPQAGLASFG